LSLIQRFQGEHGRRQLTEVLRDHKIVSGNAELAQRIADTAELVGVPAGTVLIQQDHEDNDVFLVIAGAFDVSVNGKKVARRFINDHVGEMSAIQPTQRRAAAVIATEPSVVCRLSAAQLFDVADEFPGVWLAIAKELARRLEQRNALVTAYRPRPRLFIISSVEALPIARAVHDAFEHDDFRRKLWTDDVFRASWYPVETLEEELDLSDFAVAIVQPDDVTRSRGVDQPSPRDNVIFELGIFIGRLGRKRSFLLQPRGQELRLPSDLKGITALSYNYDPADLATTVSTACNSMRKLIEELGPNN
jgi:CRP/FNR family cyclic AMP-dependent transcriptional regulator